MKIVGFLDLNGLDGIEIGNNKGSISSLYSSNPLYDVIVIKSILLPSIE
jgi:hypothetical protein